MTRAPFAAEGSRGLPTPPKATPSWRGLRDPAPMWIWSCWHRPFPRRGRLSAPPAYLPERATRAMSSGTWR